jgi:glycosyltransferase involved in cell wall biosynthesis
LIVDSIFPTPDRDSGSIDAINLVDALHFLNYQVVFVAVSGGDATARLALENKGVIVPDVDDREDSFFATIKPFLVVAFLSRVWSGGLFLETIRRECPSAKIIFNTVDLSHIREERVARLNNDRLRLRLAAKTKVRELTLVKLADATIVVSHEEHRLLTELVPLCNVYTIPLARDVAPQIRSFDQSSDIAFIGGYMMETNVDAVIYFLDEIWPIVRRKLPHAKFIAMGAAMPDVLLKRSDLGFVPRGYVENLSSALNGIRVMVAPLRAGAGAKGKVATALAHGIPCVASSVGAEGMSFKDRHSILIADSPQEFAAKVCEVYTCSALWSSLSNAGLHLMAHDYSPAENIRRIANIIKAVGL